MAATRAGRLNWIYGSERGRPSYPLFTYVKLLLLQQWYGLSDTGLEEAVDDRLSFRRFAGLPLDESVPDHSTIWRFRQERRTDWPRRCSRRSTASSMPAG